MIQPSIQVRPQQSYRNGGTIPVFDLMSLSGTERMSWTKELTADRLDLPKTEMELRQLITQINIEYKKNGGQDQTLGKSYELIEPDFGIMTRSIQILRDVAFHASAFLTEKVNPELQQQAQHGRTQQQEQSTNIPILMTSIQTEADEPEIHFVSPLSGIGAIASGGLPVGLPIQGLMQAQVDLYMAQVFPESYKACLYNSQQLLSMENPALSSSDRARLFNEKSKLGFLNQ